MSGTHTYKSERTPNPTPVGSPLSDVGSPIGSQANLPLLAK